MQSPAPKSSAITDLIQSVTDRGRQLIGYPRVAGGEGQRVIRLAQTVMSGRGEASGVVLARQLLEAYAALPPDERRRVLLDFAARYGTDVGALQNAAEAFLADPSPSRAATLRRAGEPPAQELIRRLNLAEAGTAALVAMRRDVMEALPDLPDLGALDGDFVGLFQTWFNRGFLTLRRIDWSTPANILEKIIRYEAVHAISGWDDLRRRLEPKDRRLYAFFHPALVDEPLIFIEVALTDSVPAAIGPLLDRDPTIAAPAAPTTAVFYSISNAQAGLRGVNFGSFLIKHVVEELKRERPGLTSFVTLSPVPGFAAWLQHLQQDDADKLLTPEDRRALHLLDRPNWMGKAAAVDAVNRVLLPLAAHYFLRARRPDGRPIDPVARFHLGNGARLDRLNPLGDLSAGGLAGAHGLMVNYLYEPETIEANHELFANKGTVVASAGVRRLLRRAPAKPAPANG